MSRSTSSMVAARGRFAIAGVSCDRGQRAQGELEVARGVSGPLAIPVILARGAEPGPVVAVDAGLHGDEYDGMEAVRHVVSEIDLDELKGTVVGIPCVNIAAFESASRESGIDGGNLNRIFPGSDSGTITERIAATFAREVIAKVDVLVDLHTGGTFGQIVPLTVVQRGHEQLALDLGRAAGHRYLWLGGSWSGTARVTALEMGKPAVTIEAGGGTFQEETVALHVESVWNILRHLQMIPGPATYRKEYTLVTGSFTRAAHAGFFRAHTLPGDEVERGRLLATTVDHFGRVVEAFEALSDGVVLWMRRLRTVLPGQEVVILGEIEGRSR